MSIFTFRSASAVMARWSKTRITALADSVMRPLVLTMVNVAVYVPAFP